MTGLAKQLYPGIHPDRAENWQDNGAEKIFVQWKKNPKKPSKIFLTTHSIKFIKQKAEERKPGKEQ